MIAPVQIEPPGGIGRNMYGLIADLYPICRSITGDGVRATLQRLQREIPLEVYEVASGTEVFDWTTPREWNIRDAWVKDSSGRRIIDFRNSNLHVLNYSIPVHATMNLDELRPHLFTLPDHPDWVPYRTSYYRENWGFCLTHTQLSTLPEDTYEVCIDSSLEDGALTWGECVIGGETADEVLISCHVCHPSLCNDNLSGIAVATFLAKHLASAPRRLTYRFLFIPGTIGAITWLALNRGRASRIQAGLVLTCVGDSAGFHYKKSRRGNTLIDRAMAHALHHTGVPSEILEFSPYGYDERQYCSPGFDLPVGCLMRSVFGTFPEYHTSADDLTFVSPERLEETLQVCTNVVEILDRNCTYRNLKPHCEPQLGKRGLYRPTGGEGIVEENLAQLWILNLADGHHTLLDIAERSGLPFQLLHRLAVDLSRTDLLSEAR
jgi:aminopeptidase-like protein